MSVTNIWLQLGERHELMAWEFSFLGMDRENGRLVSETLMVASEKHDSQEVYKLGTSSMHAPEVIFATGGSPGFRL